MKRARKGWRGRRRAAICKYEPPSSTSLLTEIFSVRRSMMCWRGLKGRITRWTMETAVTSYPSILDAEYVCDTTARSIGSVSA
jgi:hypothetical protein